MKTEHAHPECAYCGHYRPEPPASTWQGYCEQKEKLLCCGESVSCADFTHVTWQCVQCSRQWTPEPADPREWPRHCGVPAQARAPRRGFAR